MVFLVFRSIQKKSIVDLTRRLVEECITLNISFKGPIPLPRKIKRWTVLRSPHIDKKSREQFELRSYYRMLILPEVNERTDQWLLSLCENLPAGIEYRQTIRLKK